MKKTHEQTRSHEPHPFGIKMTTCGLKRTVQGACVTAMCIGTLSCQRTPAHQYLEANPSVAPHEIHATVNIQHFDHDHRKLNAVLSGVVFDEGIDYQTMKVSRQTALQAYLDTLAGVTESEYASWSVAQKRTFVINAHNAYVLKKVCSLWPISSVRDVGKNTFAFFNSDDIALPALAPQRLSLNYLVQHELRGVLFDARVHFALFNGSRSGPVLRKSAYRADDLDAQLNEATSLFVNDTARVRYDEQTQTWHLSALFAWFSVDFERQSNSVVEFIGAYRHIVTPRGEIHKARQPEYLGYDWSLNQLSATNNTRHEAESHPKESQSR